VIPSLSTGTSTIAFGHDRRDRPYLLHVPATAKGLGASPAAGSRRGLPLVLELHGRGINPVRFDQMTGLMALADEAGFAVAAPAAIEEMWNDGRDPLAAEHGRPDDVTYLAAVLADVPEHLAIDPGRIFVVGMSNGATMAARLVCERADLFAAVAQVGGTAPAQLVASGRPGRPVPILSVHGSSDPFQAYEGGASRTLRRRIVLPHALGTTVSVDDWARFWVRVNGASEPPLVTAFTADTTVRTWHGPTPASDVVFYRVEGGGHTWPGAGLQLPALLFGRTSKTFSAARVVLDFFAAHGSGPVLTPR
jgi:polyhydroxybutyrate depolymerase